MGAAGERWRTLARLSWTLNGPLRGDASLVAGSVPSGGGSALLGRTRDAAVRSAGTGAAEFFDEDWKLSSPGAGSRLRLRLDPVGAFFLSDLRVVRLDPRADAVLLL